LNVDAMAPAGAISSTVLDMASWLRFLLRSGLADGRALISREALAAMWTTQISVGGSVGYGMGWFVRTWRGQRLIEHGVRFRDSAPRSACFPILTLQPTNAASGLERRR
jgi:CubicO group peptidase (beta-lactamase class C family)